MNIQNWDMVYQRPPLTLDALLIIAALFLHAPMMYMKLGAPEKHRGASRLVNIDYIEQQIKKRQEKPAALPPKIPASSKDIKAAAEKMKTKFEDKVFKRPAPPMTRTLPQEIQIKTPESAKLQEKIIRDMNAAPKLQGKGSFQDKQMAMAGGPGLAAASIHTDNAAGKINARSGLSDIGGAGGPTLKGKSGFQMAESSLPSSIGGGGDGTLSSGGLETISVPTGARARSGGDVLSPTAVLQDKGSLQAPGGRGGAGEGESAPRLSDKKFSDSPGASAASQGRTSAPSFSGVSGGLDRGSPSTTTQRPMFQITGPLAKRQVLSRSLPTYPEWARAKGIEASVILQFTVTPEGAVKDNIQVVRTSGYPDLDQLASRALSKWKFITLPQSQWRDEVGTITFNYSIR